LRETTRDDADKDVDVLTAISLAASKFPGKLRTTFWRADDAEHSVARRKSLAPSSSTENLLDPLPSNNCPASVTASA
jgi:hypothetical protein